ncbi:MAG TPA: IS1182 family transposase [Acidiferrobacterales bacterium]|nr:IS1182 family transposase [Acidiferrobacterales bacterium]
MARYKPTQCNGMFIPVVFDEQIQPGTFEFALHHLVEDELDLSALDAKFHNDQTGAPAYDPRAMLKIVLLAYSRGLITSRKIEAACEHNVLFMALSGDARPSYTHIAKFVRELGPEVHSLFTQVLLTCDRLGLIGRSMFAIDGVKLPANASKERSGTHAELAHRAQRLDKAAAKIVALHQAQDEHGPSLDTQRQARVDELKREAQATRDFIATSPKRTNRKGQELKTNVTDPDSAKMATSKGVIQGYAAQAAVDSAHQVVVAADIIGSGSEQSMLLPMIEQAVLRQEHTLITADAGYYSDDNIAALHERSIPALIADNAMRQRDERIDNAHHKAKGEVLHDKRTGIQPIKLYRPEHFQFHGDLTASCPAGQTLTSNGSVYTHTTGAKVQQFKARDHDCQACALRQRCLKNPASGKGRTVSLFGRALAEDNDPSQKMRRAIDSAQGRALYSRRIATVEPVFANIRHHKRMSRFTLRGKAKVSIQWRLYCLVHNIEKIATKAMRTG